MRKAGLDYLKRCIDFAADLGSPFVSGPMYAAVGAAKLLDEAGRRGQWLRAVSSLRAAAAYAQSRSVKLAVEPLNRFESDLINTVDQGLRLVREIGADNVGLLLDTFHMNSRRKTFPQRSGSPPGRLSSFTLHPTTAARPVRIICHGRRSPARCTRSATMGRW